ncbi:protein phosphatase 2C domain-containing protein [Prosthecomicrobium sp. N25]|uniref:protein phosphatase 2C domain-containing protein n=1 Tax=Prosthecomicrobium sp. N25 TaxID=3129254 RepID=UPI0030770E51
MPLRLACLDALTHGPKPPNEDAHGVAPRTAWVIDGATGVGLGPDLLVPSGAAWLAGTLSGVLADGAARPDRDIGRLLAAAEAEVTEAFRRALGDAPAPEPPDVPTACLGLVHLDAGTLELGVIGDISIIHRGPAGESLHLTDRASEAFGRETLATLAAIRRERPDEDHWPRVREQIRRNRLMANRPGGYSVVHPVLPWAERVTRLQRPAAAGDVLLVASDGFFRLVDHFGLHSEDSLVEVALAEGLAPLLDRLRHAEAADPHGEAAPRVKRHDDATAVLLRLETEPDNTN